ncbi:hypothetical protein B0H16DRAFT_1881748 [Mycena metata]|uniref:HNH nuclease domain-containing protein n=1 Tax=Mycena metata TaxID=1033252 RepID=A0AAD7JTD4_9AGAR|nr:hypothetical protein B0H16DRAFT_1881748 [Mycena metata]
MDEATREQRQSNDKERAARTLAQAKADTLVRDGYKCVITGLYDQTTFHNNPKLRAKAIAEDVRNVDTELVHLFSESAQSDSESAASASVILKMFGLPTLVDRLGNRVHNSFNVMTMCGSLRKTFHQLLFWLEAVPNESHTYTLFTINPDAHAYFTHHGLTLKLPHPELIAIRAVWARVAAMSGATEQFWLLMEDRDDAELGDSGLPLGFAATHCVGWNLKSQSTILFGRIICNAKQVKWNSMLRYQAFQGCKPEEEEIKQP